MKKKLTFALALTLALVLAGVALAASLNVFGLFKDDEVKGKQLSQLAEVAQTYGETITKTPQTRPQEMESLDDYQKLIAKLNAKTFDFTLEQAYADNKTLYISYTLKVAKPEITYHEGQPSGDFEWYAEGKRWLDDRQLTGDPALKQELEEFLNQPQARYFTFYSPSLADGASLLDGTDLPIQDSGTKRLEDGTVQGYTACRIPESVSKDQPLEAVMNIIYGYIVVYQDEAGYKEAFVNNPEDRGMKRLTFTIARNGKTTSLVGSLSHQADTAEGSYTAQAQAFLSPVNIKGTVTIKGSQAWIDSWHKANAMMDDATGTVDRIYDYVLYAGDTPYVNKHGGISLKDNGDIVIDLDFDAPGTGQPLHLRPVYRDGEIMGEDIVLK